MAWFRKEKQPLESPREKRVQTEGLWVKCDNCKQILWKKDLEANLQCCPKCGHHFKMGARARLEMLFDDGRYTEHDAALATTDPLNFHDTFKHRHTHAIRAAVYIESCADVANDGVAGLDDERLGVVVDDFKEGLAAV